MLAAGCSAVQSGSHSGPCTDCDCAGTGISRESRLHCWGFINRTSLAESKFRAFGSEHGERREEIATDDDTRREQYWDTIPPYSKDLPTKRFTSVKVGHGCNDLMDNSRSHSRLDTACATRTTGQVECFAGEGMKLATDGSGPAAHINQGVPDRVKFRSGTVDIYNEGDNGHQSPQYACGTPLLAFWPGGVLTATY